jgi:hypothetical protein
MSSGVLKRYWTLRAPKEFCHFVLSQGFEIESLDLFPVTGTSLKQALRHSLSVSCVMVGIKR